MMNKLAGKEGRKVGHIHDPELRGLGKEEKGQKKDIGGSFKPLTCKCPFRDQEQQTTIEWNIDRTEKVKRTAGGKIFYFHLG